MASVFTKLYDKKLISAPSFLKNNVCYEVIMGSMAYGSNQDNSDMDVYGFGIPPKDYLFPHLAGVIKGFGNQGPVFDQFMQHHIKDGDKEYDITIFSIVKFFQLCMEGNPNMVDALFVPDNCVIYTNQIGNIVRHNRKIFLHKDMYWKFQGYAKAQLHKMGSIHENEELNKIKEFESKHKIQASLEDVEKEILDRGL